MNKDQLQQVGQKLQELQPGDPGNTQEESSKYTLEEANYTEQAMMCGNCSRFLGDSLPENCELVQGHVNSNGLCQYWDEGSEESG